VAGAACGGTTGAVGLCAALLERASEALGAFGNGDLLLERR
jgi:NaMN:DMB phosphoribosyltransferase